MFFIKKLGLSPEELYENGIEAIKAKCYNKALIYLVSAADKGHIYAMLNAGRIYELGYADGNYDYQSAYKYYMMAAEAGNIDGMYEVAKMIYWHGAGDNRYERALYWYNKAADAGHVKSKNQVAYLILSGKVTDNSITKAIDLLNENAKIGDTEALNRLGQLYLKGKEGVNANVEKALKYLTAAAEQGDTTSQSMLGDIYFEGKYIETNYELAAKWWLKLIETDKDVVWYKVCYNLGTMYRYGLGVKKDIKLAQKYLEVAAEGDYEGAIIALKEMNEN